MQRVITYLMKSICWNRVLSQDNGLMLLTKWEIIYCKIYTLIYEITLYK